MLATGENISAGASFAALFKHSGRALLIGEETGSDAKVVIGGTALPIVLPNSHILVRIPTVGTIYAVKKTGPGRGTRPHIRAVPTIKDLLEGTDPALQTVIDRISRPRSPSLLHPARPQPMGPE